jgi:hypothetical protein
VPSTSTQQPISIVEGATVSGTPLAPSTGSGTSQGYSLATLMAILGTVAVAGGAIAFSLSRRRGS